MISYIYAYGSGFISGLLCALVIALWRYLVYHKKVKSLASEKDQEWVETSEILKDADISREDAIDVCMNSMHSALRKLANSIYDILENELDAEQATAVSDAIANELAGITQNMKHNHENEEV